MALGFGRNAYPRRYGGGVSIVEVEHLAILDALAPGWDTSSDLEVYADAYSLAVAVSIIWAVNARLKNQALPMRMLENLTTWEEATRSFPGARDGDVTRRRRVAAKLRGFAGNAIGDISELCDTIMGANFIAIHTVDPADEVCFWPGGPEIPDVTSAPGPPGFEWSSNRLRLWIELSRDGISEGTYLTRSSDLYNALSAILPAWMAFTFFLDTSGFLVDFSQVGVNGL
jgi:hypothetical protein